MGLFIKIDDFAGSVTAPNYRDWSELHSLHFSASRRSHRPHDHRLQPLLNHIHFSDMSICKRTDPVSHHLFHHMCTQKRLSTIDIHICHADTHLTPYIKYQLQNSFVRQMDTHIGAQGEPTEHISLSFSHIISALINRDNNNQPLPPLITGYNVEKAEAM